MQKFFMMSDSVSDDCGMCEHTVIENQDGEILLDQLSGDWCESRPNAYASQKWEISKEKALEYGANLKQ